jgi:hypothetical protein
VARGLTALHGTGKLNGAPEQQQFFGLGGLAGVGVRNDRECAAPLRLVGNTAHLCYKRLISKKFASLPDLAPMCLENQLFICFPWAPK